MQFPTATLFLALSACLAVNAAPAVAEGSSNIIAARDAVVEAAPIDVAAVQKRELNLEERDAATAVEVRQPEAQPEATSQLEPRAKYAFFSFFPLGASNIPPS